MASTSTGRFVLIGVALAALVGVGGCIFIDAQFALAPDGSTSARLEAGVLKSMLEQGEGDFVADIGEGLAPGRWQELGDEDRGEWRVRTMVGQAGPGEALFTEEAEAIPQFGMTSHLLSTAYTFTMPVPEGADMQPQMTGEPHDDDGEDAEAEHDDGDDAEGHEVEFEGMDEAMGEMMALMMSSGEAGLRFSVALPGEIVEANGEVVAPDRAAWAIDIVNPDPDLTALSAESRLLNWPNVGRLGGELVAMGRWELVAPLIAAVRRGVVPDPVTEDPTGADLNAEMYAQIIEIMMALDVAVGEQITDTVMQTLGLSGDDVDAGFVAEIAERVKARDLAAEIDGNVTDMLLGELGGG